MMQLQWEHDNADISWSNISILNNLKIRAWLELSHLNKFLTQLRFHSTRPFFILMLFAWRCTYYNYSNDNEKYDDDWNDNGNYNKSIWIWIHSAAIILFVVRFKSTFRIWNCFIWLKFIIRLNQTIKIRNTTSA